MNHLNFYFPLHDTVFICFAIEITQGRKKKKKHTTKTASVNHFKFPAVIFSHHSYYSKKVKSKLYQITLTSHSPFFQSVYIVPRQAGHPTVSIYLVLRFCLFSIQQS